MHFLASRLRFVCSSVSRWAVVVAAVIIAPLGLSNESSGSILGVAGEFNGFVFGDLTSHGADTEGRLAVGGNLHASSYGVGAGGLGPKAPLTTPLSDNLVVGGNLNAPGKWQVFNGNAVYGGALIAAPTTPNGTTYKANPVDFAAAQSDLTAKSDFWSTLTPNGSTVFDGYSTLTLTTTIPGLNVFNVSEAVWEKTSNKQIVNAFPDATMLVNIAGVDIVQSGGMSYNNSQAVGTRHSGVLLNFFEAQTLVSNGLGMLGSVLSPHAHVTLNGGGINGNGIVGSVTQHGGEFHNFVFTGDLPNVVPVPEPSSWMLLGGLGVLGLLARCRRGSPHP